MSGDYEFGLVVAVEQDGTIVRPLERCDSKYDAAQLCMEYAKRVPGTLYVAMACYEAYRSEPKVEKIWLSYAVAANEGPSEQPAIAHTIQDI